MTLVRNRIGVNSKVRSENLLAKPHASDFELLSTAIVPIMKLLLIIDELRKTVVIIDQWKH